MESYDKVYRGKHKLIDSDTGEIIEVDKVYRRQTQGNFVKAYIKGLVMMLDVVGGSKLKVVNYLLENLRLSDNKLIAVSYTHLRAHETPEHLVCRLLLEKKKIITVN
ncbi:Firmicute plasmid replication protein (RepL) [Clostridioides difficile]|nr:Firmicute plasmid replication protein (RepL) [Clostridioides difficile]